MQRFTLLVASAFITIVLLLLPLNEGHSAPEIDLPWETPQLISTGATHGAFRPVLSLAPNGTMMIAYNRNDSGDVSPNQTPYFSESTDFGQTWSTPAPIHISGGNLRQVSIAYDQNGVAHAVWRSGNSIHHSSRPQWPTTATTVVATTVDLVVPFPHLAVGADNVLHVVWAQAHGSQGLLDIFHSYSNNGGTTWSAPQNIVNTEYAESSVPVAAVDADLNLHVLWEEKVLVQYEPGEYDYEYQIHYKEATKNGSNYSWPTQPTILSGNLTSARRPAIVVQGNDLHITFARQVSSDEQYPYYRSYTPANGWQAAVDASNGRPVSVNTNAPFYLISSVATCNNGAYVYYHGSEDRNAKEQIFGDSSYDNWAVGDIVTTDENRHVNPSLVCRGGSLFLATERVELATVNHQVYFIASRNINQVHLPVIMRP